MSNNIFPSLPDDNSSGSLSDDNRNTVELDSSGEESPRVWYSENYMYTSSDVSDTETVITRRFPVRYTFFSEPLPKDQIDIKKLTGGDLPDSNQIRTYLKKNFDFVRTEPMRDARTGETILSEVYTPKETQRPRINHCIHKMSGPRSGQMCGKYTKEYYCREHAGKRRPYTSAPPPKRGKRKD